jgi:hypothetical protein
VGDIVIENCQMIGGSAFACLSLKNTAGGYVENVRLSNITIDMSYQVLKPMSILYASGITCDQIDINGLYCHLNNPPKVANLSNYNNLTMRNCWFVADDPNTTAASFVFQTYYANNKIMCENILVQNWDYFILSNLQTPGATIFCEHVNFQGVGTAFQNFNDWENVSLIDYRDDTSAVSSNRRFNLKKNSGQGQCLMSMDSDDNSGACIKLERFNSNGNYFNLETGANNNSNFAIHRNTGNYADLAIDNNGRIGMGTPTPGTQLHLKGADAVLRIEDTNDSPKLEFVDSSGVARGNIHVGKSASYEDEDSMYYNADNGESHYFSVAQTNKMIVGGSGVEVNGNIKTSGSMEAGGQTFIDTNGYLKPKISSAGSAQPNSIYIDSTSGKLCFKDGGGTPHDLY